jgi:hypothetical protein
MNSKNIWKLTFLFIFLNFTCISFSQEIKKQSSWIIKGNTTALIDIFSFPTVQFAVEKKINNYFSIQTEIGYQLYDLRDKADTVSVKVGGFKINTEGRFYLFNYLKKNKNRKRNSDGIYAGIQAFYRENKYNKSLSYTKEGDESMTLFDDSFGVVKTVYGANLALGFQKQIHKFIMEPYIYIGYMNKKVENPNREFNKNLGHTEDIYVHDFFSSFDKEESSGNMVNFSFGLRLGYRF